MANFHWRSGNGGGALEVVVDSRGRTFGWLCDGGCTVGEGPRVDCFEWWIDGGPSGEDSDYARARAALGNAAAIAMSSREVPESP